MSLEKNCLKLMKESPLEFLFAAQQYRIQVLSSGKSTKHTDEIFAYFLLLLLAEGETKRFCLIRASIDRVVDSNSFPYVGILDKIWTTSLVGDLPKMKQAVSSLPPIYHELGQKAVEHLTLKEQASPAESVSTAQEGKLQKLLKVSELFFRV
ncbi:hypothetical protein NECID01_1253 [Nematocida sp. AWRm77]|nr:hypothetical protein NECID01_1253 [Nematocida sp. AWRm77]